MFLKILFRSLCSEGFPYYHFQCVKSILNLLRLIPKEQNLRYILTIVDDLLEVRSSFVISNQISFSA